MRADNGESRPWKFVRRLEAALEDSLPAMASPRLEKIRIAETERNIFEVIRK